MVCLSRVHQAISFSFIFDHPRSGMVYGCVYLSVCLSVCMYASLIMSVIRKTWRKKFIFTHRVYLQGIQVKFVYEGHRVKVKVTGAKEVVNARILAA